MKKRYKEPDVLKGIAIIGTVLIHVTSTVMNQTLLGSEANMLAIVFNQIFRFSVPIFFIFSGWGLTFGNKFNGSYISFIKCQISKILGLYFLWSIFYYVLSANGYSVIGFIKSIILGTGFYHLYYVPVLILFYALYPIMFKIARYRYGVLITLLVTVVSQLADYVYPSEILNAPQNIFNWVFFFVFGIWLSFDFSKKVEYIKAKKRLWFVLFLVSLAIVLTECFLSFNSYGSLTSTTTMRPSIILYSVMVCMFGLSINTYPTLLLKLSKVSFLLYLSHALVLSAVERALPRIGVGFNSLLYIPIAFLIVISVSYTISIAKNLFINLTTTRKNNSVNV